MTNIQSKPVPAPSVVIESFVLELNNNRILAMVAVEDNEECTIFSINQIEFETWADDNDLRAWDYSRPGDNDAPDEEESGEFSWASIYEGYEILSSFLKAYIEFLYEQEAMDFQPSLNKILSAHKAAI